MTPGKAPGIPARLIITIGGFGAPQHEVRWRRQRLQFSIDTAHGTIEPSPEAWKTFWAALDQIGVWGWGPRYDNPEICDGTQWEIDICDGVRSIRCFGSNQYPGGPDRDRAKPFQEFLAAVSALIQQTFG